MTWIFLILSVSSVLIGNSFFILKKEKEEEEEKIEKRKEKKKKRGKKRFEIKAPCNNSDLVIPFKHDQVLLNFNVDRLVNTSDQTI